jgi:hypothetical protein
LANGLENYYFSLTVFLGESRFSQHKFNRDAIEIIHGHDWLQTVGTADGTA